MQTKLEGRWSAAASIVWWCRCSGTNHTWLVNAHDNNNNSGWFSRVGVSTLSFIQSCDTVGWITEGQPAHKTPFSEVLFRNKRKKTKGEPSQPRFTWKMVVKTGGGDGGGKSCIVQVSHLLPLTNASIITQKLLNRLQLQLCIRHFRCTCNACSCLLCSASDSSSVASASSAQSSAHNLWQDVRATGVDLDTSQFVSSCWSNCHNCNALTHWMCLMNKPITGVYLYQYRVHFTIWKWIYTVIHN